MDKKPLIVFGQDECIFKQFSFYKKMWHGSDGQQQLLPKDEGEGVMVSGFCSREFGFGFPDLSAEDLLRINRYRVDQDYLDSNAALKVCHHTKKAHREIKKDPFVEYFEYGENKDGYWTYDHMVLQLEDCVDVLKVLGYCQKYDILFLFDHSCGHDRKRSDALCVHDMNKEFGGKQKHLRDSVMTLDCLGPFVHDSKLKVGDVCKHTFPTTGGTGPFYLSSLERESRRSDRPRYVQVDIGAVALNQQLRDAGFDIPASMKKKAMQALAKANGIKTTVDDTSRPKTKKRYYSKAELAKQLDDAGFGRGDGLKRKELQERSIEFGLPKFVEEEEILEGWEGKPKGLLQVLWERGWIDPAILNPEKHYTMDGKPDEYGHVNKQFSLVHLMANTEDFVNELTLLQHMAQEMGVKVDRTPKCHPEIAGEGIEYIWGFAKLRYRNFSVNVRRRKEDFLELVKQCLQCHPDYLSRSRVQKFARKARAYTAAYYIFHFNENAFNDTDILDGVTADSPTVAKIEKLMKCVRTHRSSLDFDKTFCEHGV